MHNEGDTNGSPPPAFPVKVGRPYAARMPGGLAPMPSDGRPAGPLDAVRRWIDAYNHARDDELLALADEAVVVRPLRFQGRVEYRGHAGLRAWLDHIGPVRPVIACSAVDALDDERVLVEGVIEDAGTVVGLFHLRDGRVARAETLVSDREVLQHLGLI